MATLERVIDMQKRGMGDNQIAQTLMQEGISPKEVSDSLSQAKIKSAVGVENSEEMQPSIMNAPQQQNSSQGQQYAYSDSTQQNANPVYNQQAPQQQAYAPQTQQYSPQAQQPVYQEQYAPQQYQDPNAGQQQYQDPNAQQYSQGQGYGSDLETIRDIAKREIEGSILKLRQQVEISIKISSELKSQVQMIDARLSKTEMIIQELQSAIIRKMGEYGEAISGISQEVQETQKSFSKMINPLLDKKRGVSQQQSNEEEEEAPTQARSSKSSDPGFKNYLR